MMIDEPPSAPSSDAQVVEVELSTKLLTTEHLNVVERAILGGRVRFSVLLDVVSESLLEQPYFPTHLRPDSDFHGAVIEKRGDTYWIHEKYESGVGRFGPTKSRRMRSLSVALRSKLASGEIDGVIIDFDR